MMLEVILYINFQYKYIYNITLGGLKLKIALYFLLFFIIVFTYILLKSFKKNILITLLCTAMIVYFILYPQICITSTLTGAKIFFQSVFPSLFPFLVISNILLIYDGISIYSKVFGKFLCYPLQLPVNCSFVLVVSALCGYPLGAKYACDLYEKKMITSSQCERLLNIASNASPLFIVGAVGTTMLNSPKIGYFLLLSNYLSCVIMGFILPAKINFRSTYINSTNTDTSLKINFGSALKESIDNGIKTVLSIGGYITMFSVITDIIKNNVIFNIVINNIPVNFISKEIIGGLLLGFIEITKGCYIIASSNTALISKIFIIGFFLGFSGISIISQVYSFTFKHRELSLIKYIRRKLVQGIVCGLISTSFVLIFSKSFSSQPVMSQNYIRNPSLAMVFGLLLIIPIIFHNIKKLFHIP
jgi:sporulation integral membrane protein YlbJ